MIAPSASHNTTGQIALPLSLPAERPIQPNPIVLPLVQDTPRSSGELNLVASHVLIALVSAVSFIGIVFWAFLRLWLFE